MAQRHFQGCKVIRINAPCNYAFYAQVIRAEVIARGGNGSRVTVGDKDLRDRLDEGWSTDDIADYYAPRSGKYFRKEN